MSSSTPAPTTSATRSSKFDARRSEIIAAALRVIERDGLHAASVRAIAHEMGYTTGVISHHFRTKDDLTSLACNEVTRAIARRVTAASREGSPGDQLSAVALAVLPDDAESERAWAVWLHFLSAALHDRDLMARHADATAAVRSHIARMLDEFRSAGLLAADLDTAFEAAYLYALIEGLGTHAFVSADVYGPRSFSAFVTEHLERLFAAHPPTTTLRGLT